MITNRKRETHINVKKVKGHEQDASKYFVRKYKTSRQPFYKKQNDKSSEEEKKTLCDTLRFPLQ